MRYVLLYIILFLFGSVSVQANLLPDSDFDGVPDYDEINIYHTDPQSKDTDGDGYSDWEELNKKYSPLNSSPVLLSENDFDNDGLSDDLELRFKTDLSNPDTDNDGYLDGEEVNNGYNPLSAKKEKLKKRIEIDTKTQRLSYFLGGVRLGKFLISSGVPAMPTPKGHYKIINKVPKAWSPYGLWMPYWMGLGTGRFGIHELPIWPNGYREGEDHLGKPASHGCVRLGTDSAKFLYNWAEVGTPVFIY